MLPASQPVITAQNRSFKWGDGLFETAQFYRGQLLLANLHFERLFGSLKVLNITVNNTLTQPLITEKIAALCHVNNCAGHARIRLAVFRNELNEAEYVIEATPLNANNSQWQTDGLSLCLYPYARKAMDAFANIKSANFLPYVMAAKFAAENNCDDALVLNAANRLCDTSRANIFLISGNEISTPALHQGCVNGIMRRVVIDAAKKLGMLVHQGEVSEDKLLEAEEVFLTNALQVVRWVKNYKNKTYNAVQAKKIFDAVAATIFQPSC